MRKLEIRKGHGVSLTVCTDTRVWPNTVLTIQEMCGMVPYLFTPAGGPKSLVDFQEDLTHHETIGVHYDVGVRTFIQVAHLKICRAYQIAGYNLTNPEDELNLQLQELQKAKLRLLDSFGEEVDIYLAIAHLEVMVAGPNFLKWIE